LKKLSNPRDSYRLPGGEYTGESITNTNNSTNICLDSKSFLGMPIGTRRSCLMKKTGGQKSRDTVPLSMEWHSYVTAPAKKPHFFTNLWKNFADF
jgi:hypothetical protein